MSEATNENYGDPTAKPIETAAPSTEPLSRFGDPQTVNASYVGLDAARALARFNEAVFAEIQAFERATGLVVDAIKVKREDNELSAVKTTVS